MPGRTNIEWADYSSNPLRVMLDGQKRGWACVKVSPGCVNCYAQAINRRFGTGLDYTKSNADLVEWYMDQSELDKILRLRPKPPYKNGRKRPVMFPFDMTDVFEEHVPNDLVDEFMSVVKERSDIDFMILTKRADRMREFLQGWCNRNGGPLPNLFPGVSAEDQKRYDERINDLVATPAENRFLSLEPLLSQIDLCLLATIPLTVVPGYSLYAGRIGGVIVGGESGRGARECNTAAIADIIQQCQAAGANVFVKQLGSNPVYHVAGNFKEGHFELKKTLHFNHSKGGDINEWPAELRIRNMPV